MWLYFNFLRSVMMLTSLMVMSNKEVNDHWNVPCYNHSRVSHSCLASHLLTMDIIIIINGGGNDDCDDIEYGDAAGLVMTVMMTTTGLLMMATF